MRIHRIVNSVFTSNTFIVSEESRAVVIDVGDFEPLKEYVEKNGLEVEGIFLTHTHYDHIYGLKRFMEHHANVPIYTSEFGKAALNNPKWNFSRYHDDEILIESPRIGILRGGERLKLLDCQELEVIATPGHDKSCLSFRIGKRLFTGDSYIPGVKVIASFPNSDREEARRWYEILEEMSKSMSLYPGHGDFFELR